MALMNITEYLNTFSKPSRPDRRTIIRWIENNQIYGEKRGKAYYVDPNRKVVIAVNELVLRVMSNGS